MKVPALSEIDKIRQEGLRPEVVGCILYDKQLLFVYKKEHRLWQLPQGGINNNETIEEAIIREMTEELGIKFGKTLKIISIFGEDQIIFPPQSQGTRKIKSTNGKNIFMIGKKYFFIALKTNFNTLDITQTDFDGYEWLDYSQALRIANSIYQKRKSELTIEIIQSLRKKTLL